MTGPSLYPYNTDLLDKDYALSTEEYALKYGLLLGEVPQHKGWVYQLGVQSLLDCIGIPYDGASSNFYEFQRYGNNTEGYDILVFLPNGKTLKIECKFRSGSHICNKWFEKEFLSKDCDLLVINKDILDSKQKNRLRCTLFTTTQFKDLLKNTMTHRIGTTNITNVTKYKLKNTLFKLLNFISTLIIDTRGTMTLDRYIEYVRKEKYRDSPLLVCDNCKGRSYCNIYQQLHTSLSTGSPPMSPNGHRRLDDQMRDSLETRRLKCLRHRRKMYRNLHYQVFEVI